MAVASSRSASKGKAASSSSARKDKESNRTTCPGVRVVGGRIYDSENGKTCHQCRQKTMDFAAACKNQRKERQCTIKFCYKCLLNRYGEKAEDVALLDYWNCPKCRGICNCSFCMRKRGHKPTGQLVQTAKATGFSSVFEMLQIRGHDHLSHEEKTAKDMVVSPKKSLTAEKVSGAALLRKPGKENSFDGDCDSNLNSQSLTSIPNEKKSKKKKRKGLEEICNSNGDGDVSLRKKGPKRPKMFEEIAKKEKFITHKEISKKEKLEISEEISKIKRPKISGGKKKVKTNENDSVYHERVPEGVRNDKTGSSPMAVSESFQVKKYTTELQNKKSVAAIRLPEAASLTTVAGIEMSPEDVGHALQFLEFCAAFGEVLGLKKGRAEFFVRELMCGRSRRRGKCFPIVEIHVKLLSLIQKDMGEESPSLSSTSGDNSWLQALSKCVSESTCALNDIPSNCFDRDGDGYDKLDGSKKLKLLNFLCDEALATTELRSWIDNQNAKYVERAKESREKVIAAKDKEKQLKQKLQDEVAKAIIAKQGAPLSISEHDAIVSEIKSKAAEAHSEWVEAMDVVSKKRQRSDAVRTEHILLQDNGHALWRLKGCHGEPDILLQDIEGTWDAVSLNEKWFAYDADQVPEVEKYISSLRAKRPSVQKYINTHTIASGGTNLQNGSSRDLPCSVSSRI